MSMTAGIQYDARNGAIAPVAGRSCVVAAEPQDAMDATREGPAETAHERPGPSPPPDGPAGEPEIEKEATAEALMRLAGCARPFRATDGRYYASIPVDGHLECHELDSAGFRRWLSRVAYQATGRLPAPAALASATRALEARADTSGRREPVCLRVGCNEAGSSWFLDLGDQDGRAAQIRPDGWEIVHRPGVHFRRTAGQLALPLPARDGSIHLLRKYINVDECDYPLLIAGITAACRPVGPYPLLILTGEQGSAKSTLALVCRSLIDPNHAPLRADPSDQRDLMITAYNNWFPVFNNISSLPVWFSDSLCRLSTGAGFSTRSLYSNDQEMIWNLWRPVIINGIDDFARRADFIDRGIWLHLPPILGGRRRCESDFWAEFHADHPRLVGGLLDAVSGGMRFWPEVQLPELPRMADFARWGEAVAISLGWPPGTFLNAYSDNRRSACRRALEYSPVAEAFLELFRLSGPWTGTATELLERLNYLAENLPIARRGWPTTPSALAGILRRIAPQLRTLGIFVRFDRGSERRLITIERFAPRA